MKIICYGDSNTYGYDPRSFLGDRYNREYRWVDILQSKSGWEIYNKGMNGRMIPISKMYFPESYDLLIIMLGTNDLLQFESPENAVKKMELFLSSINIEHEKIMLIAPPKMQLGEWVQSQELVDNSGLLAKNYRALAKKLGIRFADAGEWGITLTFDGVHFSEEGHKIFAEKLFMELTK